MAKSIYKNKSEYDPGRFRFGVGFYVQTATDDGSGGSIVSWQLVNSTRAIKDKFYEGSTVAIEANASTLNGDCAFVIRYRRDWHPEKDMNVLCDGVVYTISGIQNIDVPVNYWKLLCVKKDINPDIFPTT